MSVRHMPTVVWTIRRGSPDAKSNGYVRTTAKRCVSIEYWRDDYGTVQFVLSRQDARMLARRINECLEASAAPSSLPTITTTPDTQT